jgi:hypothetical protein
MPSQEDKIIEELVKTGFPTEIVSASVMQERGWYVLLNPSYFDVDEGKSREFDIRAFKRKTEDHLNKEYSVGIYLVTECKKSEKPWVFFTTPEDYGHVARLGNVIKRNLDTKRRIFTDNSSPQSVISDGSLKRFHHYFQHLRLARTFHQPFRGEKEQSKMIYSAVMSVIKATLFLARDSISNSLRIFYPLVIFSGDLFEAQVQANKDIRLLRSKHLQLSFNYFTPEVQQAVSRGQSENEFIIDIVYEDYLDEFLKIIEKEHEEISSLFFSVLGG